MSLLSRYPDKLSLTQAIRELKYKPQGNVDTAGALRTVRLSVMSDSRLVVRRVVIMITTSRGTSNSQTLSFEADRSRQDDIETYVIGIGNSIGKKLKKNYLLLVLNYRTHD